MKSLCISGLFTCLVTFAACEKAEELPPEWKLTGEYQLADLVVVNSGEGVPLKQEDLNVLNNLVYLYENGTFSMADQENRETIKGFWNRKDDILVFHPENERDFFLRVLQHEGSKLELEQRFESGKGLATGAIYYEFIKKYKQ